METLIHKLFTFNGKKKKLNPPEQQQVTSFLIIFLLCIMTFPSIKFKMLYLWLHPFELYWSIAAEYLTAFSTFHGLPKWLSGEESDYQCRRCRFNSCIRKIPWRRKEQCTPVFLSGKCHEHGSLAGYSPWGHQELDMTEQLNRSSSIFFRNESPTRTTQRKHMELESELQVCKQRNTEIRPKISILLQRRGSFGTTSLI